MPLGKISHTITHHKRHQMLPANDKRGERFGGKIQPVPEVESFLISAVWNWTKTQKNPRE